MDKENKSLQNDGSLKPVQEAYGFSENQLLNEFAHAQNKLDGTADNETVHSGYQKILAKIESRGVMPEYHDGDEKKKSVRLKHHWRPLLVAAILGVLMVGLMAVGTYGKKYYRYTEREVDNGKDVRLRTDGEVFIVDDDTEAVYKSMEDELTIPILELSYIPFEMEFQDSKISGNAATIIFGYKDKYINFIQMENNKDIVAGYSTDCQRDIVIVNEWLGQEINVEKNMLENKKIEYRSGFEFEGAYYSIKGIMDEEEFVKVLEGINYFK